MTYTKKKTPWYCINPFRWKFVQSVKGPFCEKGPTVADSCSSVVCHLSVRCYQKVCANKEKKKNFLRKDLCLLTFVFRSSNAGNFLISYYFRHKGISSDYLGVWHILKLRIGKKLCIYGWIGSIGALHMFVALHINKNQQDLCRKMTALENTFKAVSSHAVVCSDRGIFQARYTLEA